MKTAEAICLSLAARREELGLSKYRLGKKIGCTMAAIRAWETGYRNPSLTSIVKWAKALGVELELVVSTF